MMIAGKIAIAAGEGYDVIVGDDLLTQAGGIIADTCGIHRIAIVTDDEVAKIHLPALERSLRNAGFPVITHVFAQGEASKTMRTCEDILTFLADNHFTRSDIVVALGGGVVGDIAGFAAATYLRGIRHIQIPTTLLAAVDSSVGGKTAVDLPAGKNLVGAFHQPTAVICDTDCLSTLPDEVFADGMAEVLKYGLLCDKELFERVLAAPREHLAETILRCVDIKRFFVESDEREVGLRRYLNLGHTIGHAVEQCSGFTISHGRAVAIGLTMMARACEASGDAEEGTCERVESACLQLGLPVESPFCPHDLGIAALADKKRSGDALTIVGIASIGECFLEVVPANDVERIADLGSPHPAAA